MSKKIYSVVGVMGLLIATELFTLLFAMNTLSSVRAFVEGEGLWSKAQKDAVLNLQRYSETHDLRFYQAFLKCLQIPAGDKIARTELAKEKPDLLKVAKGFRQGGNQAADIPGIIHLIRNFHSFRYLRDALMVWAEADQLNDQLLANADRLQVLIHNKNSPQKIFEALDQIDRLNEKLTELEVKFSATLGEGSRFLERFLMVLLFCAVITVETIGFLMVISFNRTLSRSLNELHDVAEQVSLGKFEHKIPVRSKDELGRLATIINKMTADLRVNIGKRERAENANRVKSLFLANMSHEIRTPLSAIIGFTELLRNDSLTNQERREYIEIIHRTSGNLTKIINDILDLSKVEAGHIEVEKIDFSLKTLLADLKNVLDMKCRLKSIELKFEEVGDLPDIIHSDPFRIRQILMNLLSNAIKFTSQGFVRLKCELKDDQFHFSVEDTGIGISLEQSEDLFQAFRQVDSSFSRKYEGTGLGLLLSRRLANLLGGDVVLVKSTIDVGSCFDFYFKYEPADQKATLPPRKISSYMTRTSGSGKRILLVEDVEDNRVLIHRILTKNGFKVTCATNGKEGVEKATTQIFDLVLMDIQMPVMDGYAATQKLRDLGYAKPIIALTAHAMKEDRNRCLQVGCNDYLTKPLQINELLEKISSLGPDRDFTI